MVGFVRYPFGHLRFCWLGDCANLKNRSYDVYYYSFHGIWDYEYSFVVWMRGGGFISGSWEVDEYKAEKSEGVETFGLNNGVACKKGLQILRIE